MSLITVLHHNYDIFKFCVVTSLYTRLSGTVKPRVQRCHRSDFKVATATWLCCMTWPDAFGKTQHNIVTPEDEHLFEMSTTAGRFLGALTRTAFSRGGIFIHNATSTVRWVNPTGSTMVWFNDSSLSCDVSDRPGSVTCTQTANMTFKICCHCVMVTWF